MTDFAETPSTVIDTEAGPSASGGGVVKIPEPAAEAPSTVRADLEAAFKEDAAKLAADKAPAKEAAKEPEKAEKPDPDAKAENKDEAKPEPAKDAKADDAKEAEPAKDEAKPDAKADAKDEKPHEAGKYQDPPKTFLADSRELYRNVPRAVRRDIETMVRTHDEETTRYREASTRYDSIREFDELARSNGRDLRDSLTRVHQIESLMQQNPIAGLNAILMETGPRKADGQPFSLFEVAQHIAQQGPEGYQRMVQPPRQQQAQEDPRVGQLQQQLQQIQEQQLAAQVIAPFKADHPRYDELQDDIAFFLQSGKVPESLSPYDRLEAAYDMAARINPPSHVDEAPSDEATGPDRDRRAGEDFSGSKSIKSSPGSIDETVEDQASGGESIRDSISKAAKRLRK